MSKTLNRTQVRTEIARLIDVQSERAQTWEEYWAIRDAGKLFRAFLFEHELPLTKGDLYVSIFISPRARKPAAAKRKAKRSTGSLRQSELSEFREFHAGSSKEEANLEGRCKQKKSNRPRRSSSGQAGGAGEGL